MNFVTNILNFVSPAYLEIVTQQIDELLANADPRNSTWWDKAKENFDYLLKESKVTGKKKIIKAINEDWSTKELTAVGFKIGARGGDDQVYQKNPKLQEILPRGLFYLNGELVIFAYPKFFGLQSGDDDDTNMTQAIDPQATQFLMTNKANGEMAHIAWYAPTQQWVIGSKNRKIIAGTAADLAKFEGTDAYVFAVAIGKQWFKLLEAAEESRVEQLQEFLKLSHLTLIFEIEQTGNQHVVPLYQDQLVLIGVSAIYAPRGLHPAFTHALANWIGCTSVVIDMNPQPLDQLEAACENVSKGWESEGGVIYLMDDQCRVVQLIKKKAWWYIVLRAIREKIRSHLKSASAYMCQQMTKRRLHEIHNDLHVPLNFIQHFTQLSQSFIAWYFSNFLKDETTQAQWQEKFIQQYPIMWNEFLQTHELPQDQSLMQVDLDQVLSKYQHDVPDPALLVMFQGLPGLGKNYLAEQLSTALQQAGLRSTVIDQDRFLAKYGFEKSGQACLEEVQRLVFAGEYDVVLLARNNANKRQYSRYLAFPKYIFITARELTTKPLESLALCTASVLSRQSKADDVHPTDSMKKPDLACLPFKFLAQYNASPVAFQFDYLIPEAKLPNDQKALYQKEFNRVRNSGKDIFKAEGLNTVEVFNHLDLTTPLTWRRPVENLVAEMVPVIKCLGVSGQVPLEMQFIGIKLCADSRQLLEPLLAKFPGTVQAEHVTLTHSVTYQKENTWWPKALALIGREVTMTGSRYKTQKGKVTALEVKLDDDQVTLAVQSGVPHVTLKLHGGQAYYSVTMLKDQTVDWDQLDQPLKLKGEVMLLP